MTLSPRFPSSQSHSSPSAVDRAVAHWELMSISYAAQRIGLCQASCSFSSSADFDYKRHCPGHRRSGGAPSKRRRLVSLTKARQERACRYQCQDTEADEVPNHENLQAAENRSAANCVLYWPPRPATARTAPNAVASLRRGRRRKLFRPGMQRNEPAESHCQRGRQDGPPRS